MNPPIDAPRLSDISRHRIREAVFRRLDDALVTLADAPTAAARPARRRRTALVAAACGALASAAVVVTLVAVRGGAPGSASFSRVSTDEAPSRVTVGEANLTLAARSAMTVSESADGGVVVTLEQGAIECAVAPRGERPPFVVLAADVRVEVVGTQFSVTRAGDAVDVVVDEGIVRVARAGAATLVKAGGRWPDVTAAAEPELEIDAEPEPEPEPELEPEPETMDPLVLDRPRPARRPQAAVAVKAPETAPADDSTKALYKKAQGLESSRPGEALALYEQIAAGGGAWAPNALFAQASLELDLKHRDRARRLLTLYLRRYPKSLNAPVARKLLDSLR